MAASSSSGGDDDYTVMETDPTGQYLRYGILLEKSKSKSVYRGFDTRNGKEICWIKKLITKKRFDSITAESELLSRFKCFDHILETFKCWIELIEGVVTLNAVTEFYSDSLGNYCKKHQVKEDSPFIAQWAKQIFLGLQSLHDQQPEVFHPNLSLDDIVIMGPSSVLKIADISCVKCFSKFGGETQYDAIEDVKRAEIYSIGVCLIHMVNCNALEAIKSHKLKKFAAKCLKWKKKTSMGELLKNPFLNSVCMPCMQGYEFGLQPTLSTQDDTTKKLLIGQKVGDELSVTSREIVDVVFMLSLDNPMMDEFRAETIGMPDEEAHSMIQGIEQLLFEFNNELVDPVIGGRPIIYDTDEETIQQHSANMFNPDMETLAR